MSDSGEEKGRPEPVEGSPSRAEPAAWVCPIPAWLCPPAELLLVPGQRGAAGGGGPRWTNGLPSSPSPAFDCGRKSQHWAKVRAPVLLPGQRDLGKHQSEPQFVQRGHWLWTVGCQVLVGCRAQTPSITWEKNGVSSLTRTCGIRISLGAQQPVLSRARGTRILGSVTAAQRPRPGTGTCGAGTTGTTREWARKAESQAQPRPTEWDLHFTRSPGGQVPINI